MHCNEINELLTAYLDNELTNDEKLKLESHLSACRQCREELEGLALMREQLKQVFRLRADEVSPSFQTWEKVKQSIVVPDHSSFWEWLFNTTRSPVWRTVTPVILILMMAVALWQTGTFSLKNSSESVNTTVPGTSEKVLDSNFTTDGQTRQSSEVTGSTVTPGIVSTDTLTTTSSTAIFGVATAPPNLLTTPQSESVQPQKGAAPGGSISPVNPVYSSAEEIIYIKTGESFSIGLNVTLRLGAKWQIFNHDENMLILDTNSIYIDDNPENPGLGGTQYFMFTGVKSGVTTIEFNLSNVTDEPTTQNSVFTVEIK